MVNKANWGRTINYGVALQPSKFYLTRLLHNAIINYSQLLTGKIKIILIRGYYEKLQRKKL